MQEAGAPVSDYYSNTRRNEFLSDAKSIVKSGEATLAEVVDWYGARARNARGSCTNPEGECRQAGYSNGPWGYHTRYCEELSAMGVPAATVFERLERLQRGTVSGNN